jgi:hypothetical protein
MHLPGTVLLASESEILDDVPMEKRKERKKKKKQNYVCERITLKSYEPLKIISTRYCAIKNPK